jgi:Tetrapyrrole (Corrin/Porphyrin) Methylases
MVGSPDIVLAGYGVRDTLQLTVETQRAANRARRVFALAPPPNLLRHIESLGMECVDLGDRLTSGRPFAEAYLDVADIVLRTAAEDPPAVLLAQGNPLFLNSLNRFLALEAGKRDLILQTLPGVSLFDTLVCDIGLDIGAHGLQLFDARRLVERKQALNPAMPAIVLQLAGLGATASGTRGANDPARWTPLACHLGSFYPQTHAISLVNTATEAVQTMAHATAPLARFSELVPNINSASVLYIDACRA